MAPDPNAFTKPVRLAISILIMGHLLAVVLPPLSVQTRSPIGQSPSVATALGLIERYSQMVYIDRGYAFFAPDPGPSHLIQAAVTDGNGTRIEQMYPDRDLQWPRLLYHRHFMLSEFMETIYQPPGPSTELQELDSEQAKYWREARMRYQHVRKSVVNHLKRQNPDRDVAIRRVEHLLPDLIDYQRDPIELDDDRMYRVLLDQNVPAGDSE